MQMMNASDLKPYIKALVFGPSGAGKTTFGVTGHDTPGLCPVLLVRAEEGANSASHTTAKISKSIETREDIEAVANGLHHRTAGYEKFKTVVIDTGTRLQETILDGVVQKRIDKRGTGDIDDVHKRDWGDCGKAMKRIIRSFLSLDMHVIVLAHDRELYPQVPEGKPLPPATDIVPAFTPSLVRTLRGYFNHVWYIKEHEGNRYLLTSPNDKSGIIRVKTHGHKFAELMGSIVKDPNLPDIYKKFQQSTQKATK